MKILNVLTLVSSLAWAGAGWCPTDFGGEFGNVGTAPFVPPVDPPASDPVPVPEPTILALMTIGLVGIGFATRKRKNK